MVNVQVTSDASALPATSVRCGVAAPPLSVTVYVVEYASAALGVSVTVRAASS